MQPACAAGAVGGARHGRRRDGGRGKDQRDQQQHTQKQVLGPEMNPGGEQQAGDTHRRSLAGGVHSVLAVRGAVLAGVQFDSQAVQLGEAGESAKTGTKAGASSKSSAKAKSIAKISADDDTTTEKPKFAPMPRGYRVDTVTLEAALKAFQLPRLVGETPDGLPIKANIGRFGPYIQVDNPETKSRLFISIKPYDPHTITLDEARELYAAKLKAEAEKNIADFGDGIKVLNGRFGPYITDGNKNVKVPKDTDPKTVTHEQAKTLLADAPEPKKRLTRRRRASASTAKSSTKTTTKSTAKSPAKSSSATKKKTATRTPRARAKKK